MDVDEAYFFDTYALIEIIKGNIIYEKFKNCKIAITVFNIVELHYSLLRDFSQDIAETYTNKYWDLIVDVDLLDVKNANYFKYKNKKKKLSTTDVIGYTIAKKLKIKFLTGDKEFKDMPNVEFVK